MPAADGIAFHDYALIIGYLNNEPLSYRNNEETGERVDLYGGNIAFHGEIRDYGVDLEKLAKGFTSSQGKNCEKREIGEGEENKDTLAAHLYNPAAFVTFGPTDNLSIAAIDSLDFILKLRHLRKLPLNNVSLHFCPTLESLHLTEKVGDGADKGEQFWDWPFWELTDVFNKKKHKRKGSVIQDHKYLNDRPLIAVTNYSTVGFVKIGAGLLFQQEIYKTMARRIIRILDRLIDMESKGRLGEMIKKADIESFRCCFLDPQGSSDLTTLMFCNNYSVITAVVMGLRELTIVNILEPEIISEKTKYKSSKKLKEKECLLGNSIATYNYLQYFGKDNSGVTASRESRDDLDYWSKCHCFIQTTTTVGITQNAIKAIDSEKTDCECRGYVFYDTHLNYHPGHYKHMKQIVKNNPALTEKVKEGDSSGISDDDSVDWCTIGIHDSTYRSIMEPGQLMKSRVTICRFINNCKKMGYLKGIMDENLGKHTQCLTDRCGVYDISTELYIPTPVIELDKNSDRESKESCKRDLEFREHLSALSSDLFSKRNGKSKFCIKTLEDKTKLIGTPSPLSYWIFYLFTDFANCLENPLLFTNVLDIWDIYESIYKLIVQDYSKSFKERVKAADKYYQPDIDKLSKEEYMDRISTSMLTTEAVDCLEELVTMINSALLNRTQVGFKDVERWQKAIDMNGGMAKLAHAADGPGLSATAILRWIKQEHEGSRDDDRDLVSSVTMFGYKSRSIGRESFMGYKEGRRFIIGFDLNILHMFNPELLQTYIHEVGHEVARIIKAGLYKKLEELEPPYRSDEIISGTEYEEIVASMLVYRFIYDEPKIFFRNYVGNYYLDPVSMSCDPEDTHITMANVFMRGFMVVYGAEREKWNLKDDNSDKEVLEKYVKFLDDASGYFPEFGRIMKNEINYKAFKDEFIKDFRRLRDLAEVTWKAIDDIYGEICESGIQRLPKSNPTDSRKWEKEIVNSYKKGLPIIRERYQDKVKLAERDMTEDEKEKYGYMHILFLVRKLIGEHIRYLYDEQYDREKGMILSREKKEGWPDPERLPYSYEVKVNEVKRYRNKCWNDIVLDRNYNGFFTTCLSKRKELLKRRIVVIKTFWDISTTIRARRFKHLLKTALESGGNEN